MSLEIYPTFPKIRADQLDLVDWTQVNALMNLISASGFKYLGDVVVGATNWNTLTSKGYYRVVPGGTGGSSIPPVSINEIGVALILPYASGRVTQVIIQPSLVVSRHGAGSTWANWRLASGGGLRYRAGLTANTPLSNSSAAPTTVFSFTPTTNFNLASGDGIATLILTVRLSFEVSSIAPNLVGGQGTSRGSTVEAWPLAFFGDLFTIPFSVQFTAILQVVDLASTITVQAYGNNTAVSLRGGTFWDDPNPSQTLLAVTVA